MSDDLALIKQCKDGDHNAFKVLYEKYAQKMMAIATRYSKDRAGAEDIVQDAFVKVFKRLDAYTSTGSFEGWIKRILVNTAIDQYHKTGRDPDSLEEQYFPDSASESHTVIQEMSAREILDLINDLPNGYKMVFNLYAIEGYKHQEIAEKLNISEGTSKSQLAKARKVLQQMLAAQNIVRE